MQMLTKYKFKCDTEGCGGAIFSYTDTLVHLSICLYAKLSCTEKCITNKKFQGREQMRYHLENECKFAKVQCVYCS